MKLNDVFNSIIHRYKIDDLHGYMDYLQVVYGGLFLSDVSDCVCNQLIEFEVARLEDLTGFKAKEITNPEELLEEYSTMAFEMARMTLHKRINCEYLANQCEVMFKGFIDSDILNKTKPSVKKTISETLLDLKYAGGNQKIASIRMAPIIRMTKENN